MTDKELTKAVVSIYRKACADMEALIKSQSVPVYTSMYGMRRWFKHNDNSQMVTNGKNLMYDVVQGRITMKDPLAQASPAAVKKLKNKIVRDIVDDCRRSISNASSEIVRCEQTIHELVRSGKMTEKRLKKILAKGKL